MKYRIMMMVEVATQGSFVKERMLRVEVESPSEDAALSALGTVIGELASARLRSGPDGTS